MIISNKYKFIFIHIPKNAGTSISESLKVATQEEKHWAVSDNTKHQTFNDLISIKENAKFLDKLIKGYGFLNYFKFAIVRNPYERMVSLYDYLNKYKVREEILNVNSFDEFINELNNPHSWVSNLHSTRLQLDFVKDNKGFICLDYIGRYEDLDNSIKKIQNKIGLDFNLKKLNVSKSRESYKQFYSNYSRNIVEKKFLDDLNYFNYKF
ncbi:sulfotransferase family 2 domain-containing protein [Mangrovimonas cancribranchiae]|uniref:Sulfotransferase family 2 domain-containing protein n=1 Tax=Mangrovimonas cancribranchiae TaxID=3080055 RepID=A0AAU6P8S9_9FLAO